MRDLAPVRERLTAAMIVRLGMSGEQVDFDDRTGSPISDDQTVRRWDEEWTLERHGCGDPWSVSDVSRVADSVSRPAPG